MNIKIVLEAKLKDAIWQNGVREYLKRLAGRVEIVEVQSIESYIKNKSKSAYIVTLELEGRELSSPDFADKLREIEKTGTGETLFLIGGAEGLADVVRAKSDFKLSLSKMTFLHQEAVLILIEQIYRAYQILNNTKYHK